MGAKGVNLFSATKVYEKFISFTEGSKRSFIFCYKTNLKAN
jgi:hypothetical protein